MTTDLSTKPRPDQMRRNENARRQRLSCVNRQSRKQNGNHRYTPEKWVSLECIEFRRHPLQLITGVEPEPVFGVHVSKW